jgi:signal transduction histidine kinase
MSRLVGWIKGLIVGPNRAPRLWLASLLIAACGLGGLWRTLDEPSLGLRFGVAADGTLQARPDGPRAPILQNVTLLSGGGLTQALTPQLLIESAGIHNDYSEHNRFFEGHRALWRILQSDTVQLTHDGGVLALQPAPKSLGELGPRFWFPWLVGLLSLSVGLALWVYRPREGAAWCYLLASAGYAFGMMCTATWGSRLLTQPPALWPALHLASHAGSFLLIGSLCVLLWRYPTRLGGDWLPWVLAALAGVSLAAEALQWVPTIALAFRLPIVLMTVALGAVFALQWRANRRDAVRRAQLKWFGLLLFMGLSTVFVAYAVGATGQVVDVPQNYGLGTVALLFVGLVPLVTRVGLFQLEAWWPRAWLWFLGGLLVVALDLVLLSALDLAAESAFALALAGAGWLYFPVRQAVWRRLGRGGLPATRDLLPQVLELVTHGTGERAELNRRWHALWDEAFQPQRQTVAPADVAASTQEGVVDEGRALFIAGGHGMDTLLLELPERGARLFSPADERRAKEITALVHHGLVSGEAFARGAREERQRIASDLHDDLGARLLSIAQASQHTAGGERIATMARLALDDMRLSVRGLAGDAAPAADVLADWRAETVTRLAAGGLTPHWLADVPPPGLVLPARTQVQLTRVLREAVSNAIRHSGGTACTVRLSFPPGQLLLQVQDNGRGMPADPPTGSGHGLPGIEARVRRLGGLHSWQSAQGGGTVLSVAVPLQEQSANIEGT